ncbi:50S ribosomal protein L5 [Candidatus Bathyarchaeota archaeon]|nr:MAG: 50S ribosomal protein L5 [Candidatus Bathyarchaeota archaeon]
MSKMEALSIERIYEKWRKNPMTKPRIGKVTVNVCVGKSGEPLEKAAKIIEQLTGQKPCFRTAKRTIKDFGIRRGEPIACVATLRKEKAIEFLRKAFAAVGNKISKSSFDKFGNFSFGIKEHIEIPGVKYNPDLGIIGMDVCVTMEKPGYRVKERKRARSKVGSKHRVTIDEAILFLKENFGVEVV